MCYFALVGWFSGRPVEIIFVCICLCVIYLFCFCFFFLSARLLLELLELLFDKFNAVATAHSLVLGYLQDTAMTPLTQQEDVKLYDMADVWVKIQNVLQVRSFLQRMPS